MTRIAIGLALGWLIYGLSACEPASCPDTTARDSTHARVWPQPPGLCLVPCALATPSPSPETPAPAVVPNAGQTLRAFPGDGR